jgi:hypothetical protein
MCSIVLLESYLSHSSAETALQAYFFFNNGDCSRFEDTMIGTHIKRAYAPLIQLR